MRNKIWITILIIVILIVLVVVFGLRKQEEDVIKIGVISPLTGEGASAYGESVKRGVLLALKEIENKKIELIFEDSKCSVMSAITAAKKLVEVDRVKMIIGDACWTDKFATITEPNKVLVISTGSAQSEVREAGDYVFRLKLDVSVDSKELARELYNNQNIRKASIFFANDNWGSGIAKNFEDEFVKLDGEILSREGFLQAEKDFRTPLLKTKEKNPEIIIIGAYPSQVGLIAKQARELGIDVKFAAYRGGLGPKTIEIGGSAVDGLIFLEEFDVDSKSLRVESFAKKFKDTYGKSPNLFAAMGYDALHLYNLAIKECGVNTDCIRDYFYDLDSYSGATGTFTFDEKGDVVKSLVLMEIKNGQFIKYEE